MYKKEAFGLGDVYLIGVVSGVIGLRHIVLTLFLPFYVAVLFIIINAIFGRKVKMNTQIPFGPYICLAAFITYTYGNQIMQFYYRIVGL